jgi:folate-dependent phosphoribosylglycinamide formyltransferase PurN
VISSRPLDDLSVLVTCYNKIKHVEDCFAALLELENLGAAVIVVDDGLDSGPILSRKRVPIHPGDTEAVLHERIKVVERELLLDVLAQVISNQEGDSAQ